jgi:membrane-associated phospholipid phosphatase
MVPYLLYNIGSFGPLILYLLSCYFLWGKKTSYFYYNIGFLIDSILNIILKGIFQQPRPSVDTKQFNLAITNGKRFIFKDGVPFDLFGMPSGHAQSTFFSTVFMYYSMKNERILQIYLFISLITVCQRVVYNFHTIFQVFIGGVIGSLIGYYFYWFAQNKISK